MGKFTGPDDGDIGAVVWPIWRRFLDSDHTLDSLAAAAGVSRRSIERAFIKPGPVLIGFWGHLASGMGCRLTPDVFPREDEWPRFLDKLPRRGPLTKSFREAA